MSAWKDYKGQTFKNCEMLERRGTDSARRSLWLYVCRRCGRSGIKRVDAIKKTGCYCNSAIARHRYRSPMAIHGQW